MVSCGVTELDVILLLFLLNLMNESASYKDEPTSPLFMGLLKNLQSYTLTSWFNCSQWLQLLSVWKEQRNLHSLKQCSLNNAKQ